MAVLEFHNILITFHLAKLIFSAAVNLVVKMKIAVRWELQKVVPAYSVREL